MKSFSYQSENSGFQGLLDDISGKNPDILFVFGNKGSLSEGGKDWSRIEEIRKASGCKHLIGCSTAGELGETVLEGSVSVLGLSFDSTRIRVSHVPLKNIEASHEAGQKISHSLMKDDLAGLFVLGPGVNVNGSMIVRGVKEFLPKTVKVSGGLAGDGTSFQATYTFLDGDVFTDELVAVGFYGDKIQINTAAAGGWKPFGPHRRVTKSQGSTLLALDDKPALDLYKQYLGDKAANLPSSGLLYPFSIINEDNKETGLIRTILNVSNDDNSLIFAGDIAEGDLVTLTHASTDDLVEGAGRAAKAAIGDHASGTGAALCVSCVGRKILMGQDTEEELESVQDVFGGIPLAGFYSYGEICYFDASAQVELHNQTMTITYIQEA